jgi:hypothetical protein
MTTIRHRRTFFRFAARIFQEESMRHSCCGQSVKPNARSLAKQHLKQSASQLDTSAEDFQHCWSSPIRRDTLSQVQAWRGVIDADLPAHSFSRPCGESSRRRVPSAFSRTTAYRMENLRIILGCCGGTVVAALSRTFHRGALFHPDGE